MKKFFLFAIILCSSTIIIGYFSSAKTKNIIEIKNSLKHIKQKIKNGKIDSRKLTIIYLILQNTHEHFIHNLKGATGNSVFVSSDGHSETVLDKEGNPVHDGINDASYNYFAVDKNPLKHFISDIHPWIILGNTTADITTRQERITGYMRDLKNGIIRALNKRDTLKNIEPYKWKEDRQIQTLAIFILALEISKSDALFELFSNDKLIESKNPINKMFLNFKINRIVSKLKKGMEQIYLSKETSDIISPFK